MKAGREHRVPLSSRAVAIIRHPLKARNIAAVLVLIGLGMAGYRRLTDAGERATQTK